ncbi:MAG: DUF1330 domain-containing protein [Longimicrobiales bacterium]
MHETLMAMNILDEESYQRYRDGMLPILARYGGGFRYDFRIDEVLRSDAEHPINRVFAIHFPDREKREAFFQDPEYRQVRKSHFDDAVGGFTKIGAYETE